MAPKIIAASLAKVEDETLNSNCIFGVIFEDDDGRSVAEATQHIVEELGSGDWLWRMCLRAAANDSSTRLVKKVVLNYGAGRETMVLTSDHDAPEAEKSYLNVGISIVPKGSSYQSAATPVLTPYVSMGSLVSGLSDSSMIVVRTDRNVRWGLGSDDSLHRKATLTSTPNGMFRVDFESVHEADSEEKSRDAAESSDRQRKRKGHSANTSSNHSHSTKTGEKAAGKKKKIAHDADKRAQKSRVPVNEWGFNLEEEQTLRREFLQEMTPDCVTNEFGFRLEEEQALREAFNREMMSDVSVNQWGFTAEEDQALRNAISAVETPKTKKGAAASAKHGDLKPAAAPAKNMKPGEQSSTKKKKVAQDADRQKDTSRKERAQKSRVPVNEWGFNLDEEQTLRNAFLVEMKPDCVTNEFGFRLEEEQALREAFNREMISDVSVNQWGFTAEEDQALKNAISSEETPQKTNSLAKDAELGAKEKAAPTKSEKKGQSAQKSPTGSKKQTEIEKVESKTKSSAKGKKDEKSTRKSDSRNALAAESQAAPTKKKKKSKKKKIADK